MKHDCHAIIVYNNNNHHTQVKGCIGDRACSSNDRLNHRHSRTKTPREAESATRNAQETGPETARVDERRVS